MNAYGIHMVRAWLGVGAVCALLHTLVWWVCREDTLGELPQVSRVLPLLQPPFGSRPQGGKGERGLPGPSGPKGEKGARVSAPARPTGAHPPTATPRLCPEGGLAHEPPRQLSPNPAAQTAWGLTGRGFLGARMWKPLVSRGT